MLQPVIIRAPGFGGLNLEGEEIAENALFAREAKNLVFDGAGRLASRKGYLKTSDLSGSDDVDAIFIHDAGSGTTVISATADHIYGDTTDEQGALTHTTAHWQFQNFNDKVIGAQEGQTLISWDGGGGTDFAAISPKGGGTVDATGNCLHSAFGRLWATDTSKTVLYWSGLLDETEWPSATTPGDSGQFNMLSSEAAVRSGYDEITAINHIQDKLVVFMTNTIVILDVPEDPANMVLYKIIDNIGCIARDSVQAVGNDLVFLSRDGLRSLVRAVAEDNFPLRDLSRHVRTDLVAELSGSPEDVKSAYYPDEGIYILLFTGSTAWVFDFKRVFEDHIPRVTTWDVPTWHSIYYHEGTLYIGQEGEFGTYSGYQEDGAAYQVRYLSTNLDFGNPNIKMIKETRLAVQGALCQVVAFDYLWDYGDTKTTASSEVTKKDSAGVYGTDAWGTAVYGDGIIRDNVRVSPFGSGYLVAFGIHASIDATKFKVEQIGHFAMLGRMGR